ncbi:hypothetical protein DDB_G0289937 [Dictyostelium discoideum AX4]|uniref:Uncharacterized protein n=1 Tax=Dictyostelium discoideum TaxID=44689 RepID=Q54GS7_DICDI|nr:hypothetical protein DDB_G0289937 [Dictyostelium discoideum AX4]EAL62481.1 hypothetical protein DDB_G0289937 [Dictyostelium discoideum AX4]|eukprot:XP_635992.1 hypothetical protein DDB_G0289937 [Dictyostelium discoideum AX4]
MSENFNNVIVISDNEDDINNNNDNNKNQIVMKKEEIVFWKVFRNIVLKKKIFESIKSNYIRYEIKKYDEIVKVEWMINNGYIGLLRDKVRIAFRPLQFLFGDDFSHFSADNRHMNPRDLFSPNRFNNFRIINSSDEIREKFNIESFRFISIDYSNHFFNVIKEPTEENYIFYEQLFSNYPEYFQTSIDETFYIITEYDCMIALKVLVEKFDYSPSGRMFQRCIEIGSFNCSTYLNQTFEIPLNNITQYWNEMFYNESHQASISTPNVINERVGYLIKNTGNNNSSNIPSLPSEFRLGHLFYCILNEIKLKTLLECIETILLLSEQSKEFIESISLNKYKSSKKGDLSNSNIIEYFYKEFKGIPMLTREEINEMKFTNDELNIEVCQFSSDNQSIQKLYEMVLLFTLPSNLQENFQFYQFKYHYGKSNLTTTPSNQTLKFNCIQFGIYDEKSIDWVIPNFVAQKREIFKFCKNDTNKMTEFIMSLYKNNKLEWLVALLVKRTLHFPSKNILRINYKILQIISNNDEILDKINNLERAMQNWGRMLIIYKYISITEKEFHSLYNIHSKFTHDDQLVNYISSYFKFQYMSKIHLNHIFVNRGDEFKFVKNSFEFFFYVAFFQFTQSKNKFSFEISTDKPIPSGFDGVSLKTKIKMLHWLVENLTNEELSSNFIYLLKDYLTPHDLLLFQFILLLHNKNNNNNNLNYNESKDGNQGNIKLKEFFIKSNKSNMNYVFQYIGIFGDLEVLSIIMESLFPTIESSIDHRHLIYETLTEAVLEGRINIFKFLNENYSFVFQTSTSVVGNDNPLKKITTSRLQFLLTLSIGKGDIHMTQYLISDLKLSYSPKKIRYSKDNTWLINYYKIDKVINPLKYKN